MAAVIDSEGGRLVFTGKGNDGASAKDSSRAVPEGAGTCGVDFRNEHLVDHRAGGNDSRYHLPHGHRVRPWAPGHGALPVPAIVTTRRALAPVGPRAFGCDFAATTHPGVSRVDARLAGRRSPRVSVRNATRALCVCEARDPVQSVSTVPPASRQAARPPIMWQTLPTPLWRELSTAIAERSPKAQ